MMKISTENIGDKDDGKAATRGAGDIAIEAADFFDMSGSAAWA